MIGQIIGAVVGIGAGNLMTMGIKTITPATVSKLTKATVMVSVWAVSGLIGKGIEDTIDEEITSFQKKVEKKKQQLKSKQPVMENET